MNDFLTIEEAAKLLEVSKDTIRRRIKSNEIAAEKRIGPYGEQWMIPADQFNKAMQIQEAVPMTRLVTTTELQNLMQHAIASAVSQAIKVETAKLEQTIEELNQKLDKQESILNEYHRLVNEQIKETITQKPSLWKRLIGK